MTAKREEIIFEDDENVLESDIGDGCTALWILHITWVGFMLCELYRNKNVEESPKLELQYILVTRQNNYLALSLTSDGHI